MMPFFALGIPGALASMDVVHFHWGRCPYSLQNLHIGKEGYPTVACEMACTHDGKFIHSTSAVYGAMNDKAIVRFDEFSELLRENSVYSDVQFDRVMTTRVWVGYTSRRMSLKSLAPCHALM